MHLNLSFSVNVLTESGSVGDSTMNEKVENVSKNNPF